MARKIALVTAVVMMAVLLGASWYFSSQLIHPRTNPCKKDHFIYCDGPAALKLPFEEVRFKTPDGLELGAWFFPAASTRAVVMVHGINADRHELLRWVTGLQAAGLNLLLVDLRNHGVSQRGPGGMGMREREDVSAAVTYLLERRGMRSVGVFGVSFGAAAAIPAMARDSRIAAGVFEAGYADLGDLLAVMAPRDFHIPAFPILNITAHLFRIRTGIALEDVSPERHIGAIAPRPVFIIHCTGDDYTPFEHGQRLAAAAREPRLFYHASCTRHAEAWQSDRGALEPRLAAFYREYLK